MKPEFVIKRQGKDVVLYAGLLAEAHENGLHGIETELLQAPTEDNGRTAIVHASAYMVGPNRDTLRRFDGIGDANAENVGPMIRQHLIRMAETRAKARALRDAINIGMVSLEELGEDEPEPTTRAVAPTTQPNAQTSTSTPATPNTGNAERLSNEEQARILELREEIKRRDSKQKLQKFVEEVRNDSTVTEAVKKAIWPAFQARLREVYG